MEGKDQPFKNELNGNSGNDAFFGLAEESREIRSLDPSMLENSRDLNFLQKLHIRNHSVSLKETIHEEFLVPESIGKLSEEDELLFEEVAMAVCESDIIELRRNLKSIIRTSAIKENHEESHPGLTESTNCIQNSEKLFPENEVAEAILEKDIMQLRKELRLIINCESSHSKSGGEIEDFLCDELPLSERYSFEEELLHSQSLARDLKLYSEINDSIGEKDIMALRSTLKKIDTSVGSAISHKKLGVSLLSFILYPLTFNLNRTLFYSVAASIFLLLGMKVFFRNQPLTNSDLYDKFYQPFEVVVSPARSSVVTDNTDLNQAIIKIRSKEYNSALQLLCQVLKKDNENIAANFYSGEILQTTGHYTDALFYYNKVISNGDNLFIDHSRWLAGLCCLKLHRRDSANVHFRQLSGKQSFYQARAQLLLSKIK